MKTRKQLTKHYAERYRKAKSKKEKSQILDDFCQLMNYNRNYASWLLRNCGKKIVVRSKTGERTILVGDINKWIEPIAIRNRAQVWTFEALQEAVKRFPFPVLGIDSDNDTAFINTHLLKWCEE
jgi:hypothetical protein